MIGDKIKALRKSYGFTQQQLADKLNVSRSAVKMIESGHNKPSYDLLERITAFFNVSADYLLTDEVEIDEKGIAHNEVIKTQKEEQRKEVESFVRMFLERCVKEGIISDPNKIDDDTKEAIWSAIKMEIKSIKKGHQ